MQPARIIGSALGLTILLLAQSPADFARQASIANALVQAGKPAEAVPMFRQLAAAFPHETSIQLDLAIALYKAGDYQETAKTCKALVNTSPNLFAGWLFLGAARVKLGEAQAGTEALRKAVSLNSDDVNAHILLADGLSAKGEYAEAVTHYRVAAERMPALPRAWYGLAVDYGLLAHGSLARLNDEAASSPEALALRADLEFESAQIAKAFLDYRDALREQPHFPGLHGKVARLYAATGHPDWAETERQKGGENESKQCTADSPFACDVQEGRPQKAASGTPHSRQDLYWQAQAFLELSRDAYAKLSALPASPESYEAEARREENRGRYPEAVAAWQKALALDRSSEELQRGLALAQCHANDCASALPLLKKAMAEHASSAEWNYLYGLALVTTREPLKAISYLQNSLRLDPLFFPALGVLGEAYLESGEPAQAISSLKAALHHDNSGSRYYQLALAYRAAGQEAEARDALRRYREISNIGKAQSISVSAITPP